MSRSPYRPSCHPLVAGVFAACAVLVSPVMADTMKCVVVADDFVPQAAKVVRVDDKSIEYVEDKSGKTVTLPLERLVRLERFAGSDKKNAGDKANMRGNYMFILSNGERVSGTPGAIRGDDLAITNSGEVSSDGTRSEGVIPLKSLVAIVAFEKAPDGELPDAEWLRSIAPRGVAPTQDEVLLKNGDVVAGVVASADAETLTVQSTDGQSVNVAWENIRTVRLAAVGTSNATSTSLAPFRLTLRDGRVVDGKSLVVDGQRAQYTAVRGGQMMFADEQIVVLEHRGRVRLLADLPPSNVEHASYFPTASTNAPPATIGTPVFSGRAIHGSIAARPRSVMTWPLDGSTKTFVTRYGIPEGRPLANVTVRVKLDDKIVHEQANVRAGAIGEMLRLPLGSAKSMTLEVDFGETYDVQDDFYWVEPALLKD